jgi:hypothetical protein
MKKEMAVAKVIEFYVPNNFRRKVKWISPEQRGRVIELGARKSFAGTGGPINSEVRPHFEAGQEKVILS